MYIGDSFVYNYKLKQERYVIPRMDRGAGDPVVMTYGQAATPTNGTDSAYAMNTELSLWNARFRERDEAAGVMSKATNSRLRNEPSRLHPFALDVDFASDGTATVMNRVRSGGPMLIESGPRYLGICCVWGGSGAILRSRDVDGVKPGEGMIFDTARVKGHTGGAHCSDTVVLIRFDQLVEASRHLVDRPLRDTWPATRLFTSRDALGAGLQSLVRAAAATVELAQTREGPASHSLRAIGEAVKMFVLEQAGVFGDPDVSVPLPSAAQVQKALDIIESMTEPLTVVELAQTLNVSVRSLQIAFRKHLGALPHAAIKAARLRQARRLFESGTVTTVKEAALRLGFTNAARFAVEYRAAFGESPVSTLDRTLDG
jgi:AraC-like DNA-binding protein